MNRAVEIHGGRFPRWLCLALLGALTASPEPIYATGYIEVPPGRCSGAITPSSGDPNCHVIFEICFRLDHDVRGTSSGVPANFNFTKFTKDACAGSGDRTGTETWVRQWEDQEQFFGEIETGSDNGEDFDNAKEMLRTSVGVSSSHTIQATNESKLWYVFECDYLKYRDSVSVDRNKSADIKHTYSAIWRPLLYYYRNREPVTCTYGPASHVFPFGSQGHLRSEGNDALSYVIATVRTGSDPYISEDSGPCEDCESGDPGQVPD